MVEEGTASVVEDIESMVVVSESLVIDGSSELGVVRSSSVVNRVASGVVEGAVSLLLVVIGNWEVNSLGVVEYKVEEDSVEKVAFGTKVD